jgi:HEAT repeat protein
MTPARRSRILLSFGTVLASSAVYFLPSGAARAVDAELFRLPGRESTQPLAARLQTHDQTELLIALDELDASADADRNTRAVSDLLRAGQPDVVADHALDALARMKSRESRGVLTTFCRHRRADARVRAYTALGNLRDSRDIPTIIEGLRDSAPQVRAQVAVMLGQLQAVQAVPDLLRALPLGVQQAAASIGKLGDTASIDVYSKQLGKQPLPVMLEGYGQYLDRADIPESAKLQIIAALEEVSGATVKAFLNARVQNPSKNTTPKVQQALQTSAGRVVAEPDAPAAQPAASQVQP